MNTYKTAAVKFSLLFMLLTFMSITSRSQIIVFKTIDEYLENKGEAYTDNGMQFYKKGSYYSNFTKNGEKVKISYDTIWGYKDDKGNLFRIYNSDDPKILNRPLLLVKQGEFCLWIWGARNGETYTAYLMVFSKGLNDELMQQEDFIEQYPEYAKLEDCGNESLNCVARYLNSISEK